MTKIIKKIHNNRGFAILFAVTISAIILAIALGVANIALKEVKFGTSARSTNEAFFAADTGVECALFNDRAGGPSEAFIQGGEPFVLCLGTEIIPSGSYPFWEFTIAGLGNEGRSCTKVTVDKSNGTSTTVIAKGYDIGDEFCESTNPDRVEREIKTTY